MLGPRRFRFLQQTHELERAEDWNHPHWPKLWLYNLHYFDDLNAASASTRRAQQEAHIARWIDENPPGQGNGWEPYPCSIRIVNWIKWVANGQSLTPRALESLALQVRWLEGHLEWHLLGNHLWANAKALFFAGLFFAGREADVWREKALAIFAREMPEQVLADGGHFERSPMYHAILFEDVLDMLNLAAPYPSTLAPSFVEELRALARRMASALAGLVHPDGEIALFNDAAFDIAAPPPALFAYAQSLGVQVSTPSAGLSFLQETGYARVQLGEALAFLDLAPIGPDYLPGHAHADTLSFELSLRGERWFVDSGCSLYEPGAERLRQRATAAHNTVEVDGADSSEVWSSFRVARRAKVQHIAIAREESSIDVAAVHDGYRRLPGKVLHHRRWSFTAKELLVHDRLQGAFRNARGACHLHPEVHIETRQGDALVLKRGEVKMHLQVEGGDLEVLPSTWHPRFGESLPSRVLRWRFRGRESLLRCQWS